MIVEPDFLTHWKTRKLIELLDGYPGAPLYVLALWAHCHSRRTERLEIDADTLALICGYDGEPERLRDALLKCRFIELDNTTVTVHGFAQANAQLFASWNNGLRGGRKPKTKLDKPRNDLGKPKDQIGKPKGDSEKPRTELGKPRTELELARREEKRREDREEEGERARARDAPPDAVQYAEAQRDLIEIAQRVFGRQIHTWGLYENHDGWLSRALPIPRSQWEDLLWLYTLPADDPILADSGETYRRKSFDRLLENLRGECEKAVNTRKKIMAILEVDPIA